MGKGQEGSHVQRRGRGLLCHFDSVISLANAAKSAHCSLKIRFAWEVLFFLCISNIMAECSYLAWVYIAIREFKKELFQSIYDMHIVEITLRIQNKVEKDSLKEFS